MRILSLITFLLIFTSCKEAKNTEDVVFEEKVIDLAINQKLNRQIELKDLYDSLTNRIPEDKDEKLKLVQVLLSKGFTVTNYGRGNFFNGPRVVIVTLHKGECACEVSKYYYTTNNDSTYLRTESISCK